MLNANCLELTGEVVAKPKLEQTPAGIYHCQFSLEHRSIQVEHSLNRQAYVRIQVVVTGQEAQQLTQNLSAGTIVKVKGFLNRHQNRNGNPLLVLHAQQIDLMN